jgi:putative transposase
MSKSDSKIWVHAVWSTKNRRPLIHQQMEQKLFDFLKEELKKMNLLVGQYS